ncbi:MAG: ankyrin repeat domain-containing protein [Verrucomicrobiota bacterium]
MDAELAAYLLALGDDPFFSAYAPVTVKTTNALGDTPLHYAATRNEAKIAQALIAAGALVDARGEAGWTPLHNAMGQGSWDVAHCLVNSGASLSAVDEDGWTPLELLNELHGLETLPEAGNS